MSADGGHPIVAALLDLAMAGFEDTRAKIVPLATGRVLEVGVGTGANLRHYQGVDHLTAIEPDPHMRSRAARRAADAAFPVDLHDAPAEALPFPDASFDTVVATWVLCSVDDPAQAASEMRRVLRPGGALVFAEHTRSRFPVQARLQGWLTPCWRCVAGGCHLDRDPLGCLHAAGFALDVAPTQRDRWTLTPVYRGTGR